MPSSEHLQDTNAADVFYLLNVSIRILLRNKPCAFPKKKYLLQANG